MRWRHTRVVQYMFFIGLYHMFVCVHVRVCVSWENFGVWVELASHKRS